MAIERHPLLIQAGIDDIGLKLDFDEFMVGRVAAPDLTFQYHPAGELNTSSLFTETWLCEESPALYREQFLRFWGGPDEDGEGGRDGGACWERLRELVGRSLAALPDNRFVLQQAWLVGLLPAAEIPADYRLMIADLHAMIAEFRAEQAREQATAAAAREGGKRQVLNTWMTDRCHNGNDDQCSFDRATEYALPGGGREVKYTCCF